jgi:hypothetical protein
LEGEAGAGRVERRPLAAGAPLGEGADQPLARGDAAAGVESAQVRAEVAQPPPRATMITSARPSSCNASIAPTIAAGARSPWTGVAERRSSTKG